MHEPRVVEVGRYEELVARGGRFAALASRDDWTGPPELAEIV